MSDLHYVIMIKQCVLLSTNCCVYVAEVDRESAARIWSLATLLSLEHDYEGTGEDQEKEQAYSAALSVVFWNKFRKISAASKGE